MENIKIKLAEALLVFLKLLPFLIHGYFLICWVINAVMFFQCEFASPYKDEIIHGLGVFTYFLAGITVWF